MKRERATIWVTARAQYPQKEAVYNRSTELL